MVDPSTHTWPVHVPWASQHGNWFPGGDSQGRGAREPVFQEVKVKGAVWPCMTSRWKSHGTACTILYWLEFHRSLLRFKGGTKPYLFMGECHSPLEKEHVGWKIL